MRLWMTSCHYCTPTCSSGWSTGGVGSSLRSAVLLATTARASLYLFARRSMQMYCSASLDGISVLVLVYVALFGKGMGRL